MDPPWSTLLEHRVISSLFNVVIQTQGIWTTYVKNPARAQSDLFTVQCYHEIKGRWTAPSHTVRAQSYLFTVQCCKWDWKTDGPPKTVSEHRVISSLFNVVIQTQRQIDPQSTQLEHSVISSLFNVVIETQRQMDPYVQNTARAQSDLFTVQCCHWDSKADGPSSQHCESTEWSLHCSMLLFRLKGQMDPYVQNTAEHRVISSLFNVVIETQRQMDHPVNIVRAQSYLFTVQCCHWDSKADGCPFNTVRAQSDLFTVQCCHSDSNQMDLLQSTLSEQRVISSLFNVVIETQTQMDPPPVNTVKAQSDLFTVQCCHSDSKAGWTPKSTLSKHRVIASLFNVAIETQRQMDPYLVNTGQSSEWSLHCSVLSVRLKGRWTPKSTWSEYRVISSLFNVVIETQRQMDPQSTQSEHRFTSSLFNVVIETQRQMDPPWSTLSEHRVISSLFNVVIQTQMHMDHLCEKPCQSTEWSLHCSRLSLRLKDRWTPQNTVRAQSDLFTI